jgi:hypothetical protein
MESIKKQLLENSFYEAATFNRTEIVDGLKIYTFVGEYYDSGEHFSELVSVWFETDENGEEFLMWEF